MIKRCLDAVSHAAYVYVVSLVGALASVQVGALNVSDWHALGVAVAPAATAALVKLVRAEAPAALPVTDAQDAVSA